jgi:hypothetical protein
MAQTQDQSNSAKESSSAQDVVGGGVLDFVSSTAQPSGRHGLRQLALASEQLHEVEVAHQIRAFG